MSKMVANAEVTAVAMASLVKLVRLIGAELVAGRHRDDIDLFERCVREKLHANIEGVSNEATAAGVALAHSLIEPVLRSLRAQASSAPPIPVTPTVARSETASKMPSKLH